MHAFGRFDSQLVPAVKQVKIGGHRSFRLCFLCLFCSDIRAWAKEAAADAKSLCWVADGCLILSYLCCSFDVVVPSSKWLVLGRVCFGLVADRRPSGTGSTFSR
jgi:hypothetical protein